LQIKLAVSLLGWFISGLAVVASIGYADYLITGV